MRMHDMSVYKSKHPSKDMPDMLCNNKTERNLSTTTKVMVNTKYEK